MRMWASLASHMAARFVIWDYPSLFSSEVSGPEYSYGQISSEIQLWHEEICLDCEVQCQHPSQLPSSQERQLDQFLPDWIKLFRAFYCYHEWDAVGGCTSSVTETRYFRWKCIVILVRSFFTIRCLSPGPIFAIHCRDIFFQPRNKALSSQTVASALAISITFTPSFSPFKVRLPVLIEWTHA